MRTAWKLNPLATIFSWSFTDEPSFSMWDGNDGVQFKVFTKAAYEIASLDEKKEMLSIIWCYLKKFEVYKKYCDTTGLKMLNIFKTDYNDIISSILFAFSHNKYEETELSKLGMSSQEETDRDNKALEELTRHKWNIHKKNIIDAGGDVSDLLETRFDALKSKLYNRFDSKGVELQPYVSIDGKTTPHYEFKGLTLAYMNSENDMYTQTTEDKKGGGVFGMDRPYYWWKKQKAEKEEKKKKAEMFLTMKNLLKIAFYPKSSGVYDIKFLFSGSSLTENNKFQVSNVEPSFSGEMTTMTGLGLVYMKKIELDVNKKTNELRNKMIETLQNNISKLVDAGDDILNVTNQPSDSKITSVQDNTISVSKFPTSRHYSSELKVGKYYRTELDKDLESTINGRNGEGLPTAGGSKNKRKTKKRKNKNKRKTKKRKKSKIKGKKKRRKTKRGKKKKKTGKSNQKNRR